MTPKQEEIMKRYKVTVEVSATYVVEVETYSDDAEGLAIDKVAGMRVMDADDLSFDISDNT
jgi:hypothetical protein